jgi:hypothetical protein
MDKLTKFSSCIALAVGLVCTTASAADIEAGLVKRMPVKPEIKQNAEIGELDLFGNSQSSKIVGNESSAAATGITYFEVYAVGSSNQGWEYVSANATSTSLNHGGGTMLMAVFQYGYGTHWSTTMNGISKAPYHIANICGPLSAPYYCSPGNTITGFMYYFDFSGQQSGTFSSSANASAAPFGFWSDSIFVQ